MAFWDRFRFTQPQTDTQIVALQSQVATLREALLDGGAYDPDANLSATGGGSQYFRRLSDTQRDFDPMTQERALQTAAWLVESNPLAKRIVELVRDYVLGDGVEVRAQDEDEGIKDAMQAVIDRFWTDAYNRFDLWLHDLVKELGTYGEICLSAFVNPVDGSVRLGYIDPAEILDVLLDPRDKRTPTVVVVRRPGYTNERDYFRTIHLDTTPTSPTFGRMVGIEERDGVVMEQFIDPGAGGSGKVITFTGACFLWRVNAPTGARRGRSDLMPLADWLDGIDQHLFGEIERAALMKNFVWDVTEAGASEADLAAKQKKLSPPKPGSVRYHNDKVTWNAVTPDLKSIDAQILNDLLQSYAATGAGLPKTWLNGLMDTNRATASEMGEPAIKHLTERQRYVKHMVEELVTFQLDQAELAGRLPIPRKQAGTIYPKPWVFAVQMPEIRPKDQGVAATAFGSMVNALTVALADHAIDIETYQELVVLMAGQFGVEVNLETMRANIEKDQAEQERKMALAPYNDGVPGQGQQDKEPARQEQPA